MDSNKFLTGPELEELYLRDKTNDHLNEPENIKSLLTYVLNKDMGELTNSDFEIIDFCNERTTPEGFPDEKKLQFLHDKFDIIGREKRKKRFYGNVQKIAACFVFVVLGGVLMAGLGAREAEAGIFDWVRSLFIEEDGEQLVISTPNASMEEIAIKDGHLPDSLPDDFKFEKSKSTTSTSLSTYQYLFKNPNNTELIIQIKEVSSYTILYQHRQEINAASTTTKERNNTIYYYGINKNSNYISWIYDKNIFSIMGSFSFSELETILSYYY